MILLDSVFLCRITRKDMADGVLSFCFVVYREIIMKCIPEKSEYCALLSLNAGLEETTGPLKPLNAQERQHHPIILVVPNHVPGGPPTLHVFHGCIRNHPLYPHSLFLTLVHSYSSLEGVNENE